MSSSSVSRRGAFRQHPGCKRACTISGHPHIEGAVSGADRFGVGPVAVIVPPIRGSQLRFRRAIGGSISQMRVHFSLQAKR